MWAAASTELFGAFYVVLIVGVMFIATVGAVGLFARRLRSWLGLRKKCG